MDFRHICSDINRLVEPKLKTLADNGAYSVEQLKRLVNEINEAWVKRTMEYAKQQNEKRKQDKEEYDKKLVEVQREFEKERHANRLTRMLFNNHLVMMKTMYEEYQKFGKLQGEKLIDSCGSFVTVLSALLEVHDDVEMSNSSEDRSNLDTLRELRKKRIDLVRTQEQKIHEYLENQLLTNLPNRSVCNKWFEIDSEVRKLQSVLHEIQSSIIYLTPDHWDADNVNKIGILKSNVEETTGSLLQLLEEAEAIHKEKIQEKIVFNQNQRAVNA